MSLALRSSTVEAAHNAARACLEDLPYRALVFARVNGSVPLFWVAGTVGGPWNGENALRQAHKAHGGSCFYCKKPISQGDLSIDHAEPKGGGGSKSVQNLLVAHKGCNQKKGEMPIEAFQPEAGREWLEALLMQIQDRLNRLR